MPYQPFKLPRGATAIAHAYVDDRAYRFRGDWHETLHELLEADADRSWCSPS